MLGLRASSTHFTTSEATIPGLSLVLLASRVSDPESSPSTPSARHCKHEDILPVILSCSPWTLTTCRSRLLSDRVWQSTRLGISWHCGPIPSDSACCALTLDFTTSGTWRRKICPCWSDTRSVVAAAALSGSTSGSSILPALLAPIFSLFGARLTLSGPTMAIWVTWLCLLLLSKPLVFLVENVTQFPLSILDHTIGALYALDHAWSEPWFHGVPAKRSRVYVAGYQRPSRVPPPLCHARRVFGMACPELAGRSFCLDPVHGKSDIPTARMKSNLLLYNSLHPDAFLCDLSQNPRHRPRTNTVLGLTPTLVTGCAFWWWIEKRRFVDIIELMDIQGLPSSPERCSLLGVPFFSVTDLSRGALCR